MLEVRRMPELAVQLGRTAMIFDYVAYLVLALLIVASWSRPSGCCGNMSVASCSPSAASRG